MTRSKVAVHGWKRRVGAPFLPYCWRQAMSLDLGSGGHALSQGGSRVGDLHAVSLCFSQRDDRPVLALSSLCAQWIAAALVWGCRRRRRARRRRARAERTSRRSSTLRTTSSFSELSKSKCKHLRMSNHGKLQKVDAAGRAASKERGLLLPSQLKRRTKLRRCQS